MIRAAVAASALIASLALAATASSAPADKITPSGALKVYKGIEGALVAMVEINDSTEMLVYFKSTGGTVEGKTVRYLFEDRGGGDKSVYVNVKHGSKTNRNVLCSAQHDQWQCYIPGKSSDGLRLSYSEDASGRMKIDDVLAAYKP